MQLRSWSLPLTVLVVAVGALLIGLVIVDQSGETVIARQQAALARYARDYYQTLAREEGVEALKVVLNRRERVRSGDGFRYALIGGDGNLLAGSPLVGSLDSPETGWGTVLESDSPRRFWRVLAQPLGQGRTLVIGEDLSARDAFRGAIVRGAGLALGLTLVAVMLVGLIFNAMLFRRARGISATAERIAAGDFSARAPARPNGDVFDHLGEALNAMLTRIDELMTSLRTVTDSLTHDVRSPLTRMKGALGRALDPAATEGQRIAAIEQAHMEADQALATFSILMDIARAETGLSREMMTEVDLCAMAMEMEDLFAPVLEDAGQTFGIETPPAPIIAHAHELLLRQALGNLLHNAVTHAGPGAHVGISVSEGADHTVRLVVADTGLGVPQDQLGRVVERFVRLETSRLSPGSGLGLAIVAACAKLHGGRFVLQDNEPGLRAVLELPRPPTGAPEWA